MLDLSLELESRPDARQHVRQVLRDRFSDQLPERRVQDLMTVVTELVNNAVEHGPGGTIDVRITLEDDRFVRGKVEDNGGGEVAIRELAGTSS